MNRQTGVTILTNIPPQKRSLIILSKHLRISHMRTTDLKSFFTLGDCVFGIANFFLIISTGKESCLGLAMPEIVYAKERLNAQHMISVICGSPCHSNTLFRYSLFLKKRGHPQAKKNCLVSFNIVSHYLVVTFLGLVC